MSDDLESRISDTGIIAVFFAVTGLLFIGTLMNWDFVEIQEKRLLAPAPQFASTRLEDLPRQIEAYCTDHFGFRSSLIKGHNWVRYKLFKKAPGDILAGDEGWLYLSRGIVTDYLGQIPFTEEELSGIRAGMEKRRLQLEERGIHHLVVIVPNKMTIYPEYLPKYIGPYGGRTRLEQLWEYMQGSSAEVVDLREHLRQAKAVREVYYANDTHWNDHGGLIGYQQTYERLKHWVQMGKRFEEDDFDPVTKQWEGDLAVMMGLENEIVTSYENLQFRQPGAVKRQDTQRGTVFSNPAGSGKALLCEDSCGYNGQYRDDQSHAETHELSVLV